MVFRAYIVHEYRSCPERYDFYNYRGEDEAALRKLYYVYKSLPEQLTLEGFFYFIFERIYYGQDKKTTMV